MSKFNKILFVITITIFSFILRIRFNGIASFSLDEMISLYLAKAPTMDSFYFNHPPMYYQILKIWAMMVPDTEPFYRLLNAIFSTMATLGMGLLGYRLFNFKSAIVLMLLHAVAPLSIIQSQFLLNYSFFEALVVFQIYFYIFYLKEKENLKILVALSILLLMTNYFSLILILCEFIFLQKEKLRIEKIKILAILLIIGLPIALDIIDLSALAWQRIEYHSNELSFLPTDLFRVFFYTSSISSFVILILIVHFIYNNFQKYKQYIEAFVAVLVLTIIFSTYTKRFIFVPRYFIFALPIFLIFLERIINNISITYKKKSIYYGLLLVIVPSGLYEYTKYIPVKSPNWVQAAIQIGNQEDTLILTTIADYIKYPYFSHLTPGVVRCIKIEEFVNLINTHKNGPIWIMDIYVNFFSYQKELFEALNSLNYKMTDLSIQSPGVDPIILYKIEKK